MIYLRSPGPWSFGIFAVCAILVGVLYWLGAPDAGQLAAALIGLVVTSFGAKSALGQTKKVKLPDGKVVPAARPQSDTWPRSVKEWEGEDVEVGHLDLSKKGERGCTALRPIVLVTLVGTLLVGCSLFTAKNLRTVLDVVQVSCIIANATLPDDRVRDVCAVADDLVPAMRDVLSAQRVAAERYAAERVGVCASLDAGPDAP